MKFVISVSVGHQTACLSFSSLINSSSIFCLREFCVVFFSSSVFYVIFIKMEKHCLNIFSSVLQYCNNL